MKLKGIKGDTTEYFDFYVTQDKVHYLKEEYDKIKKEKAKGIYKIHMVKKLFKGKIL